MQMLILLFGVVVVSYNLPLLLRDTGKRRICTIEL